ncbi:Major facilitator superfamily domain general substrate transporter [Penicillium cf. griseofulvum]|uniref:Major facilitator superfamily domain general substrate transporter n=1 Tax=Penicillium cf. griseofulvum TaxID=2972120 RepID=A0A9W9M1I8_9EURO|nr:Major facilitator superfamily domain general substrate transporter [Penicillium cf. griseofulvum]KAJ5429543.1 Major facilitator superfamily domain general substrate transporter [Penicillium cf. griseofulvum]
MISSGMLRKVRPILAAIMALTCDEPRLHVSHLLVRSFVAAQFAQAGLSPDDSYKLNLGGTTIAFCGIIISWLLMKQFNWRTLYITGMGLLSMWLLIIGCLATDSKQSTINWVQSVLCITWLLTFSQTVGPIAANVIQPYMINPLAWNWKGLSSFHINSLNKVCKTGFFWFAFASPTAIWAFFRLPETKGRSYEELDMMFHANLQTRKFKRYHYEDNRGDRLREV